MRLAAFQRLCQPDSWLALPRRAGTARLRGVNSASRLFGEGREGRERFMKTLLGLLTLMAGSAASISGLSALLLLFGDSIIAGWQGGSGMPPVLGNLLMALLGVSVLAGLITAIVSALAGLPLLVLNLLLRSWGWALLAFASCASGAGLWIFFLSKRL